MSDFYTEDDLAESAYSRILLTGDPKTGKTTSVLSTAPGPIAVLNCDGPGAPMAAKRHGAKNLKIKDVTCVADWISGVKAAVKLAQAGEVSTIVVDTLTMLVNNVIAYEFGNKLSGFDIWRETKQKSIGGLMALLNAPAHVFLLAHYDIKDGQIMLEGSMKGGVPAMVHDRVHLTFDPKKTPDRVFHVGPSASGLSGGRHSDENIQIEANASLLLETLGYQL